MFGNDGNRGGGSIIGKILTILLAVVIICVGGWLALSYSGQLDDGKFCVSGDRCITLAPAKHVDTKKLSDDISKAVDKANVNGNN